jgi:hypothetical protein
MKCIGKNFEVGQNIWRVTTFIKSLLSPCSLILTTALTLEIIVIPVSQMRKVRLTEDKHFAKFLIRH